ncbi:13832_t:CDS:1 [Gigaspora rosea]|nr:13832_t:CDS:1 [Gigaspora rosea]
MDASQHLNSSLNEPTESMIEAAKNDYANRLYMHTQRQLIRAKSKQQTNNQKSRRKEKISINVGTTNFITHPSTLMIQCQNAYKQNHKSDR